jgi:hypothetical protein
MVKTMNLFSGLVGCLSVAINKRGTFINFAMQYLKHTDVSYAHLLPYLPNLVDMVFAYSKEHHYQLADELDVLEASLYTCVMKIAENELNLIPHNNRLVPMADGFIIATNFMHENNIGQ